MENNSNIEDIGEIQAYVVNMRKKYSKTISKYYEQNMKIDVKLLEKRKLKSEVRFEIPKEFSLEENLVHSLNDDLVDKERINVLRNRLRNLDKVTMQNIKMKNCDIYKQVTADL